MKWKEWLMVYGLLIIILCTCLYMAHLEEESHWKDYAFEYYNNGSLVITEIYSRHEDFDWYWFKQSDCNMNKFEVVQIYEVLDIGSYDFIRENKCTFNEEDFK